MSDKESDSDQQCQAKKRKLDEIENQNQNQNELAVAGPSNIESTSGIFKMDIDCFEELFEWLSLDDLRTLRRTSKRFKKIVDYYIKTNYPGIGKFKLNDENFNVFRQMDSGTIGWIREIEVLVGDEFDSTKFSSIETILNNVKNITITRWRIDRNIYNCFLKYCKNVKCLSIKRTDIFYSIDISSEWLNHQYPSIEYLRIDHIFKSEIDDFVKFFHLNPNIHAVSIGLECFNDIGSHFIAAGIKFDRFYTIENFTVEKHSDILKLLYDAGFYKRLCLNTKRVVSESENSHSKLAFIGIEVLGSRDFNFIFPPITSLKELSFLSRWPFIDEQYENVENVVERLNFKTNNYDNIMPFVSNFPKLKHFNIQSIDDTDELILQLETMNKERQKLAGACKTIIYVPDNVFLATKWAKTKINFNLIELKRIHACDWNRFF